MTTNQKLHRALASLAMSLVSGLFNPSLAAEMNTPASPSRSKWL